MYPNWCQFIGAVIVLTSILCIPSVLIIRLIMYRKARKQMKQFIALTKTRLRNLPGSFRECITIRGSGSWSPEVDTAQTGEIPYLSADESEGVSSTDHSDNSDESN